MPGLGEAVAGGVAGDLYVKFTVGKHPVFRRENLNLIMDLDVKMSEALLGVEKDIMTLDGLIKLKVPAGINSEKFWRCGAREFLMATVCRELEAGAT